MAKKTKQKSLLLNIPTTTVIYVLNSSILVASRVRLHVDVVVQKPPLRAALQWGHCWGNL